LTRDLEVPVKKLNLDIFIYPEKYSRPLSIEKIVADTKVDAEGVKRYKEQLAAGKQLRPIVVVKHPRKNVYAVVDGHHRFFAQLEYGTKDIACAVIDDLTGFVFRLTKDGWLQPHPRFTKHVRVPILEFHQKLDQSINRELRQNMKAFLTDFHRNSDTLIEAFRKFMEKSFQAHRGN
jgi:hypothetical protein